MTRVPRSGSVGDLCDALSVLCRIPSARLTMLEVYQSRFINLLADALPLRAVRLGDDIYAYVLCCVVYVGWGVPRVVASTVVLTPVG